MGRKRDRGLSKPNKETNDLTHFGTWNASIIAEAHTFAISTIGMQSTH